MYTMLALVAFLMTASAKAGMFQPVNLATWGELDSLVAEQFAETTNFAFIYPPVLCRFSLPGGTFTFSPDSELAGLTNGVTPTLHFGVPVWQVSIVETVDVSRVWLYVGTWDGGPAFRTNDAPSSLDARQWVRDVYREGPPSYLTGTEADEWCLERDRCRMSPEFILISSNDWPTLWAATVAAATNNPPSGSPAPVRPDDTNRLAFAAVQAHPNGLDLTVYTPVDRLPVDLLARPALGTATNAWLIRSTFFPLEPFDTWSGPYLGAAGFFLAARCDTDSDGDGIADDRETYVLGTDPHKWDSAGLALGDFARMYVYGLDPLKRDTNGDGMDDDEAIMRGMNPVTQNAGVGASTIRYLYDADDRLTATFTTTAGGSGGGAVRYSVSPAHNIQSVSERCEP